MAQVANGRVIEEYLDELMKWATMYKKPWQMGVSSHVVKALVEEIHESRISNALREAREGRSAT